jgi:DNA-binding transcriptional ArsR family regulator
MRPSFDLCWHGRGICPECGKPYDGVLLGRKLKVGGGSVHAFDVLGDPVRRRILELLATGEHTAGTIVEAIQKDFGISQAGVSQHLKVLRENGFAKVRADGPRRVYTVDSIPLQEVDSWLDQFRGFWEKRLSALSAEIARGKRERRGSRPR